jgi:HD-GYP domain-containing protein (c-di-GMP phosphodiesterase class II)
MSGSMATSATGGSASSQADSVDARTWNPRPAASFTIRALVLLIPIAVGVIAVKVAVMLVPRPDGRLLFCGWMAALILISFTASLGTQRVTRRVAPLAMLFKMSLVFPDEAPSRFGAAMRSGSLRSLARRFERSDTAHPEQAAAEALVGLITQLGRHDRLTRGHAERVRAYSVMLGEQIGLSPDDVQKLNWAALVHDIGKLQVPEELLNKPDRPTAGEWMILRTHPAASAGYIEPLRTWLGEWVDAATQHHERFDGTGYPLRLAGKDISLAGRIVAIADAYDVMTAARSYKKPLPAAQARAELTRNSGTQFDPQLVRSFLEISLGKMRRIIGPLGWLSQFPDLIRTPITAVTMSTTGFITAGAIGLATAVGAASPPAQPTQQPRDAAPHVEEFNGPVTSTTLLPGVVVDPAQTVPPVPSTEVVPTTLGEVVSAGAAPTTAPGLTPLPTTPPVTEPVEITVAPAPPTPADTTPVAPAPTTLPPPTTTPPTTVPTTTVAPPTTPVPTTAAPGVMKAVNDGAFVPHNRSVTIQVLQNDDFAGSAPNVSTLAVVAPPAHGSATVSGQNIVYRPSDGYRGPDSFKYSICSLAGSCAQATVFISVTNN